MVSGEIFGEFPTHELVGTHHAVHDVGVLEHHEVAVHGTLREARSLGEDLRDRERSRRQGEGFDERLAVGGEPLPDAVQPRRRHRSNRLGTRRHGPGVYRRDDAKLRGNGREHIEHIEHIE